MLAKYMRTECSNHRFVYDAPRQVGRLVVQVADKAQIGTQRLGRRPANRRLARRRLARRRLACRLACLLASPLAPRHPLARPACRVAVVLARSRRMTR